MPDGQGEKPIDDLETALPWAGIDDAPAAETPALDEDGSSASASPEEAGASETAPEAAEIAAPEPAEPTPDLAPLQFDDTPDEVVTLVFARDESAPDDSPTEVQVESVVDAAPLPVESAAIVPIPKVVNDIPVEEPQAVELAPAAIVEVVAAPERISPIEEAKRETTAITEQGVTDLIVTEPRASELELLPEPAVDLFDLEFLPPVDQIAPATSPERVDIATSIEPASSSEFVSAILPADAPAGAWTSSGLVFVDETEAPAAMASVPPVVESATEMTPVAADIVDEDEDEGPDLDPVPEEECELELVTAGAPADEDGAGAWSIASLCLGVAIIACAVLIPQTDFNRRLVYEREKLRRDLVSIEQQVKVNDEFLKRVSTDPSLSERLAQRQMKIIRKGTRILELRNDPPEEMSPYQLVAVPPPAPLPAYEPKRGMIANMCYGVRSRLYLLGAGLMLMAAGLVFGAGPNRE